jgi:diketogulonate reductase-like aldo/keto reductase
MGMRYVKLGKTMTEIPVIGQGCMGIGGYLSRDITHDAWSLHALKIGIDLGMTFLDTAEGYGSGHSEELVGQAVQGIRDKICIATKVSPENLSYNDLISAAEGSLRRLRTDYIDLYQIHWPNPTIPVSETIRALERLLHNGKIRNIGLCNFSLREIKQMADALSASALVSIQVEYNLFDRAIEKNILPFCEEERITTIAYSPLDQGRISSGNKKALELDSLARKYNRTPAQIILNWLLSHPSVIVIPKASTEQHIRENAEAADFQLRDQDVNTISQVFSNEYSFIPTDRIKVSTEGEGSRKVYQTVEQALKNPMGFVPSPAALSQSLELGDVLKPVRLIPTADPSGKYDYDLIEGRIRYWAWVIAHSGQAPIPSYIRNTK